MTMHEMPSEAARVVPERAIESGFQGPDRELLALLGGHVEREGSALDSYAALIEQVDDEGIRYLGRLILEDEERHHRIVQEMLNSVRSSVEELDIQPSAPEIADKASDELVVATEQLLDLENDDLAELRRLEKTLKRNTSYPTMALLAKMMIHDTRKHIDILKAITSASKH